METMASMGGEIRDGYLEAAEALEKRVNGDPEDLDALLALADARITLYIFGYQPREETLPGAREAHARARELYPARSEVLMLGGMLHMLDWKWEEAEAALRNAIATDPGNLKARHWYSLYLAAMGKFDLAMAQSDTILTMDPPGDYLIGRGSLLYFYRRNEELKDLMLGVVAHEPSVAWGYDWLGMAYIELKEYDQSISTYYRAFELSNGTVEVGGGLGHALGLAGEYRLAKRMADFYARMAEEHYLPPVQRAFIHIGIGEHGRALELLEQAYREHSWFLVFIQSEPWYDPIRCEDRFNKIIEMMNFPSR